MRDELLVAPVPVAPELLRGQGGEQVYLVRLLDPGDAQERLRSQEGSKHPRKVSRVEGSGSLLSIREKKNCHPRPSTQGTLDKVP